MKQYLDVKCECKSKTRIFFSELDENLLSRMTFQPCKKCKKTLYLIKARTGFLYNGVARAVPQEAQKHLAQKNSKLVHQDTDENGKIVLIFE